MNPIKKQYGLIGASLIHSYSKEIHEALGKYSYDLLSMTADEMKKFISSRSFHGLNVTIPYKQAVMELCDEISPLAREIGAVNTLYWKPETPPQQTDAPRQTGSPAPAMQQTASAKLVGHNTDYEGFLFAAANAGIAFQQRNVLILGTGGTSLMARRAAANQGARKIFIASRSGAGTSSGAENQASAPTSAETPTSIDLLSYQELPTIADSIDLIINTTPVGTYPDNGSRLLSLNDFPNCRGVIDVIYNPFRTALLLEAEELGLKHTNGLPMLVAQATAAAGYFLGTPGAFQQENQRIITQLQHAMENLVLIGMPGSGKTTVGKLLAKHTGKTFVDLDEEIQKSAGKSIPEIFREEGETGFRKKEAELTARIGKEHGQVISTGGGVILQKENVQALRQNGFVIHVQRPLEALATDGRPLSKDLNALKKMAREREPLYRAAADTTFDNSQELTEARIRSIL